MVPLAGFLKEYPQLRENSIDIYIDSENADKIIKFLRIRQNAKKFRRILFEILSLRYNDSLYRKEAVAEKAKTVTAMKFVSKKENVRICCKEYIHPDNPKAKKVVMLYLYDQKKIDKKAKRLIENLGEYEYET